MRVKCKTSFSGYGPVPGAVYDVVYKTPSSFIIELEKGCVASQYRADKNWFETVTDIQISINVSQISYCIDFLLANNPALKDKSRDYVENRIKQSIENVVSTLKKQVKNDTPSICYTGTAGYYVVGSWEDYDNYYAVISVLCDPSVGKTGYFCDVEKVLEQL